MMTGKRKGIAAILIVMIMIMSMSITAFAWESSLAAHISNKTIDERMKEYEAWYICNEQEIKHNTWYSSHSNLFLLTDIDEGNPKILFTSDKCTKSYALEYLVEPETFEVNKDGDATLCGTLKRISRTSLDTVGKVKIQWNSGPFGSISVQGDGALTDTIMLDNAYNFSGMIDELNF
jgi:hypothetical protein